jgi:hypothetical protein
VDEEKRGGRDTERRKRQICRGSHIGVVLAVLSRTFSSPLDDARGHDSTEPSSPLTILLNSSARSLSPLLNAPQRVLANSGEHVRSKQRLVIPMAQKQSAREVCWG